MSDNLKILIVEDEPAIAKVLKKVLKQLGCDEVWICANASCAVKTVRNENINLVFMDLNIDGKVDGIQCAKEITRDNDILIAFATSYSDEATLEEAIDINTLNYLVKPYGKKDIEITINLAKLSYKKSQIKLLKNENPVIQLYDTYRIDTRSRSIGFNGENIHLTKKEFDLLTLLAKHKNHLVSTQKIRDEVWQKRMIASSTLRETITRLRKKLPEIQIEAIHGIGYQIKPA